MRNVPHIRPFTTEDSDHMFLRNEQTMAPTKTFRNMIITAQGNVHTILIDDQPAAIVGASCMWDGVWNVWAVVTDLIRGRGLYFTKACKIILDQSATVYNVRRYNAIVEGDKPEYCRWLNVLGFQYEYTMHRAQPNGGDIFGYVKWMRGD